MAKLLLKILWKSYLFQYKLAKFTSVFAILQSYRILKFLLLKWRSFQYNIKFEMKTSFIIVLRRLLAKRSWQNSYFLIQNSEICFLQKLSSKKMRTLEHNVKIEKIPFPFLSLLLLCEKLYEKTIIFWYIYFKIHFKSGIIQT